MVFLIGPIRVHLPINAVGDLLVSLFLDPSGLSDLLRELLCADQPIN
jgi:hypothetical protein